MARSVTIYRDRALAPDTDEYLRVLVKCSTAGVDLDNQAVKFSLDNRVTWLTAAWEGDVGPSRVAHLLMTESNLPANGNHPIFTRVTDNPEAPIINSGTLIVR